MSGANDSWRLALPMYNVTPALGLAWDNLLRAVIGGLHDRGWKGDLQIAAPTSDLMAWWRAPDLLLSQTCGYPLVTQLQSDVQVLAVPEFDLPGCAGGNYRSMILVPEPGARSLAALRGSVAVINDWHSHSGMNALRHAFAPLAEQGRFFSRILVSGSHLESVAMLRRGQADVAAVDCATYGLAERAAPELIAGVRLLQTSAQAPGLPLITSQALHGDRLRMLRAVLLSLHEHAPDVMRAVSIRRWLPMQMSDYAPIQEMAVHAAQLGYKTLA